MIDLSEAMATMTKQMADRTDYLLGLLLSGQVLCSERCVNTATHMEFGPEIFESHESYLGYKYHIVRLVRYRCDEHWTYGEETVVYVQTV